MVASAPLNKVPGKFPPINHRRASAGAQGEKETKGNLGKKGYQRRLIRKNVPESGAFGVATNIMSTRFFFCEARLDNGDTRRR